MGFACSISISVTVGSCRMHLNGECPERQFYIEKLSNSSDDQRRLLVVKCALPWKVKMNFEVEISTQR